MWSPDHDQAPDGDLVKKIGVLFQHAQGTEKQKAYRNEQGDKRITANPTVKERRRETDLQNRGHEVGAGKGGADRASSYNLIISASTIGLLP